MKRIHDQIIRKCGLDVLHMPKDLIKWTHEDALYVSNIDDSLKCAQLTYNFMEYKVKNESGSTIKGKLSDFTTKVVMQLCNTLLADDHEVSGK